MQFSQVVYASAARHWSLSRHYTIAEVTTMYLRLTTITMALACFGAYAQSFKIADRVIQVHGYISQGFAYSDQNNYLTMKTSEGSFSFTDGAVNVATQLTDRLRIGAQAYSYNIGKLGNGHVQLDWAFGDYKVKDWLGFRAGKVKTALGLYNDTQDMEFLHTWALLPQSVYPFDLRADTIAHTGADMYGEVAAHKFGTLNYTVYGGQVASDLHGGYIYGLSRNNRHIDSYGGRMAGADLRWTTPIKGVLAGISALSQDITTNGITTTNATPYTIGTGGNHTTALYAQYTIGNLRIDGEYRRNTKLTQTTSTSSLTGLLRVSASDKDSRSGYLAAAYRVSKKLEIGTYHARFYADWQQMHGLPTNHIFDQVVTARIDLKSYLDLKLEGHFMDGYGVSSSDRGFYAADNPNGKQPTTNLLVVRCGFHI